MSYWAYYLGFILLSYGLRNPWLLVGILVFLVLRRRIPDPTVLLSTWGKIRRLRAQIQANSANVQARRDLARVYLDRRRPGAALQLLDEALVRDPDAAELLFLKGLAHQRRGEHAAALEPLVRAVNVDPRVAFGEPYLIAGDSLFALGRHEEAEDAYLRYLDSNSSSVAAHVRLARVLSRLGRSDEARRAVDEARSTFHQIPGYARRRQLGAWLAAQWARITIKREPQALLVMTLSAACVAWLALICTRAIRADLRSPRGILPAAFGVRAFLPPPPPASRFERVDYARLENPKFVRTFFTQDEAMSGQAEAVSTGAVLCRLWALYGPPTKGSGPRGYAFRDTQNGALFGALLNVGYVVPRKADGDAPRDSVEDFDRLVDQTKPVDCELSYPVGDTMVHSGVKNGVAFDEAEGESDGPAGFVGTDD